MLCVAFELSTPILILSSFNINWCLFKQFLSSENPDETLHDAASCLGLHCLPMFNLQMSGFYGLNI